MTAMTAEAVSNSQGSAGKRAQLSHSSVAKSINNDNNNKKKFTGAQQASAPNLTPLTYLSVCLMRTRAVPAMQPHTWFLDFLSSGESGACRMKKKKNPHFLHFQ